MHVQLIKTQNIGSIYFEFVSLLDACDSCDLTTKQAQYDRHIFQFETNQFLTVIDFNFNLITFYSVLMYV